MKLERLDIRALPGIGEPFTVDGIDEAVNLVTGPNAIGKSSLLRALRYLVAPQPGTDPTNLHLAAVFRSGEGLWRVERNASAIRWERDGRESEPPLLPASDQLDCYWLPMEALMDAGRSDDALVAQLQRTLAGGYDFQALQNLSRFNCGPRHGRGTARQLREAERARREVENHYRSLHADEEGLPDLQRRKDKAEAVAKRTEAWRKGHEWLQARRERRRLEALLGEFPTGMAKLRGDEVERLEKLNTAREKCGGEERDCRVTIKAARSAMEETGFDHERPAEEGVAAAKRALEAAVRLRIQEEEARRRWEEVRGALEASRGQLCGAEADCPVEISPATVSEAERLAEDHREAAARERDFQSRLQDLPAAPSRDEMKRLAAAAEQLRHWCLGREIELRRLRLALWIAFGLFLAAAAAAFWYEEFWAAGVAGLAAVYALALWFPLRALGTRHAARKLREWGVEEPAQWTVETVTEHVDGLESHYYALRQDEARATGAEDLQRRLAEARAEREAAEVQIEEWRVSFGLGLDLSAYGLAHFIRLAYELRGAETKEAAERAEREHLRGNRVVLEEQVQDFLEKWGAEALPGHPEDAMLEALRALEAKLARFESEERRVGEAERGLDRLRERFVELEKETRELYHAAGAEEGDQAALLQRCRRHEEWLKLDRQRNQQTVMESSLAKSLENADDVVSLVEADDEAGLLDAIREGEARAEEAGNLREEIAGIRARLADAGRERQLDRARAEEDGLRAKLRDECEEALHAKAAAFWMESVREQYRHDHEPELLTDARGLFGRFTRHEFDFEFNSDALDGAAFAARDCRQGTVRSLRELSTATRMQLLLAARLAWVHGLERGREPFPLVLDEALTTSDDRRFAQVAACIDEACREEERQLFYLTARPYEARLWRESTGRDPHLIDLERLRFDREGAPALDFRLPPALVIPSPAGLAPEDYATRISVPPVDPARGAASIHLFHLLRDDLETLAGLLREWRVDCVGRLELFLRDRAVARRIAHSDTLLARCRAARSWVDAWREGRGHPVDRIALEESGAVTERFLDEVGDLAAELKGDARLLVETLRSRRVSGFRQNSIESLEEWLTARGYLDHHAQLDAAERRVRVLAETAAFCEPGEAGQTVDWLEAGCR